MKQKERNRNEQGLIIIDRSSLEKKLELEFKLYTGIMIALLLMLLVVCIPIFRSGSTTVSLILLGLLSLLCIPLFVSPFKKYTVLRAIQNGDFKILQDVVSDKYSRSSSDDPTTYYIRGAASGAHQIESEAYHKVQQGESFWYFSVNQKKAKGIYAFPSSAYVLAADLVKYVNGSSTADPAFSIPYTAANDQKITSHYGHAHEKVKCASCGKTFNCSKHGDTCPKCGAVRVK